MPKPNLSTIPSYYHPYVKLVQEDDINQALANNTEKAISFFKSVPAEKWSYRYEEGKWSIKELLQHVIDAERIFSYRALCFARKEKNSLPAFDENSYAAASKANARTNEDLIDEFLAVRKATELLFRSFDEEQLTSEGVANNNRVSVIGIGFITAGHVQHHLNILKERYLQVK